MLDYDFKFKKNSIMVVCGFIWIFFGVFALSFGTFIILAWRPHFPIGYIMPLEMFIIAILGIPLGLYYIKMSSRSYVKISDDNIRVHKGLVKRDFAIRFNDIEQIRLSDKKISLLLKNNLKIKEIEIIKDLLYIKDIDTLLGCFNLNKIVVS